MFERVRKIIIRSIFIQLCPATKEEYYQAGVFARECLVAFFAGYLGKDIAMLEELQNVE